MAKREETIDERESENIAEFMEHGPGLRRSTRTWILAKDPERGYVLHGGLGGPGAGVMWFKETEYDRADETYDDAPIQDSRGGFGGPEHDDESRALLATRKAFNLSLDLLAELMALSKAAPATENENDEFTTAWAIVDHLRLNWTERLGVEVDRSALHSPSDDPSPAPES